MYSRRSVCSLCLALLHLFAPRLDELVRVQFMLEPYLVVHHFYLWQVLTHAFYNTGDARHGVCPC